MREVPGTEMQKKDVVDEWDYEDRKIKIHDAAGFAGMRKAGKLAAETLDFITPHVVPGVTTACAIASSPATARSPPR